MIILFTDGNLNDLGLFFFIVVVILRCAWMILLSTEWEGGCMGASIKVFIVFGLYLLGIWPESKSFSDEGMGPIPKHWKGTCEEGGAFNSSHCNK